MPMVPMTMPLGGGAEKGQCIGSVQMTEYLTGYLIVMPLGG